MSAPPSSRCTRSAAATQRVAVGDVGLDRDRAVAQLAGERLDALGAAGQQREPVTVGGEGAGGRLADARGRARDDRRAGAGAGAHDATSNARWDSGRGR